MTTDLKIVAFAKKIEDLINLENELCDEIKGLRKENKKLKKKLAKYKHPKKASQGYVLKLFEIFYFASKRDQQ